MAKIYIYITIIILPLTSCNSWLELEPVGSKNTNNYIGDYSSAVSAYNGVHQTFLNLYSAGYPAMLDVISDDSFTISVADGPFFKTVDRLQMSEGIGSEYYGSLYNGISKINTALNTIENAEITLEEIEKIDVIRGQMLFMRGYFYFTLVRLYGQVPIVPFVENVEGSKHPRASFETLYTEIEQNLTAARDILPEKLNGTLGLEYGKPHKAAAIMALTDFYIYFEKWQKARDEVKKITGNGSFTKIEYQTIFNQEDDNLGIEYSDEYNKEVIFDAYYDLLGTQGFTWRMTPMGRNVNRSGYELAVGGYCTDNRLNPHNPEDELSAYKGENGGLGIVDEFEVGDIRVSTLFWQDNVTSPDVSGYYGCIKYDCASYGAGNSTLNYPVYRYSEALLWLAEAENELNNSSEAKRIIDEEIRAKAGLPNCTANDKESLRVAILKERRIELAFEAKRFFDLNRMGLAKEYLEDKQHGVQSGGISLHMINNPITGKDNFVFPIPLNEINGNPHIGSNNPGY